MSFITIIGTREDHSHFSKARKRIKSIIIGKEGRKLSLFSNVLILFVENH